MAPSLHLAGTPAATPVVATRAVPYVLLGGAVAATLDIAYAFVVFAYRGVSPVRISQSIASGLLGAQAYQGGAGTALLGLALHFTIVIVAAGVFFGASVRIEILRRHWVLAGLLFGVAMYGFMNFVVLPLSAFPHPRAYPWPALASGLAVHALLVGLPIAGCVQAAFRRPLAASRRNTSPADRSSGGGTDGTQAWFADAAAVPSLEAEIAFLVQPNFYCGPETMSHVSDRDKFVEPLLPPDIARADPSSVRTTELLGHEAEMAAYYEQVIRLARQHGRRFDSVRHYFWMRLTLSDPASDLALSFPWYDTYLPMNRLLAALANAGPGPAESDQDQGWEIEAYREADRFYFRERDPDADETRVMLSTPRDALLAQLPALQDRTARIIDRLSRALGADVWSEDVRSEPAFLDGAVVTTGTHAARTGPK